MRIGLAVVAAAAIGSAFAAPARADGYPPFYGYSPYLGGPVAYFSPESDVRAASVISDGLPNGGTRTYYRGGPFFTYQPTKARVTPRYRSRREVLVTKG